LAKEVTLELVPQGFCGERMRALVLAWQGLFTPRGGCGPPEVAERQKEERLLEVSALHLELPIHADYALIKAAPKADELGKSDLPAGGKGKF